MKKVVSIIVVVMIAVIGNCVAEENPVLISSQEPVITLSPADPKPLDVVTFTISGDFNGSLIVLECNGNTGVCYEAHETSIPPKSPVVSLTHVDATYISYWVSTYENGNWTHYTPTNLTLETTPVPNGTDNDSGLSPIWLVIGIIIGAVSLIIAYFGFRWYRRAKK